MNSSAASPLLCVLAGEFLPENIAVCLSELQELRIVRTPALSEALHWLDSSAAEPDLVVAVQSVPHEFPASQVERLIGRLPLTRQVVAFGPWCESLCRTEQIWPVAWCVPIRHAPMRIAREIRDLRAGRAPLPATASRDEAFARDAAAGCWSRLASMLPAMVLLDVEDRWLGDYLAELLTAWGISNVRRIGPDDVPAAARSAMSGRVLHVIAASTATPSLVQRVRTARQACPLDSIAVAVDLATPDDQRALGQAGATVVLSQFRLAEELSGAEWFTAECEPDPGETAAGPVFDS